MADGSDPLLNSLVAEYLTKVAPGIAKKFSKVVKVGMTSRYRLIFELLKNHKWLKKYVPIKYFPEKFFSSC